MNIYNFTLSHGQRSSLDKTHNHPTLSNPQDGDVQWSLIASNFEVL